MVKLTDFAVPPEYAELRQKALLTPTGAAGIFSARNTILQSRANRMQRREATRLPTSGEAWNSLTPETQAAWRDAALVMNNTNRGYDLFVADYLWREQAGLSLHGTPHLLHQLFGLAITTFDSPYRPYIVGERDGATGPLVFSVSLKLTASVTDPATPALVSVGGQWNDNGTLRWDWNFHWLPQVDTDWTRITVALTTPGRSYLRLLCTMQPVAKNAQMRVDNLLLTDSVGELMRENFFVPSYGNWLGNSVNRNSIVLMNIMWPTAFVHEYFDD